MVQILKKQTIVQMTKYLSKEVSRNPLQLKIPQVGGLGNRRYTSLRYVQCSNNTFVPLKNKIVVFACFSFSFENSSLKCLRDGGLSFRCRVLYNSFIFVICVNVQRDYLYIERKTIVGLISLFQQTVMFSIIVMTLQGL